MGIASTWSRPIDCDQFLIALTQDARVELRGELSRYRPGVLRCHPDVAALRVAGAFSRRDTDASLRLLSDTSPLNINCLTRYWLSVEPSRHSL